jgi:hypothetical protein
VIIQAVLAAEAAAKAEEAQRLKEENLKESRRFFPRILGALGLRKVGAYIIACNATAGRCCCCCNLITYIVCGHTHAVYTSA